MDSECFCRFVLLDFGHPMTTNSINNIINSLENILALKLTFSRSTKQTFGISILNSDFGIFESESNLRKNYDVLVKNLQASLKVTKLNNRVTVQEYKHSLSDSIEGILYEFQKFKKANTDCCQSEIAVAIITKKTASVLAAILTDVTSKLQTNIPNVTLIKNYKVVQILNEREKISKNPDKDTLVDWTSCLDNIYDLCCFFKEWFLRRQQEMRIILSKELEVKCDVDDCMVNPVSKTFDIFNDIQCKGSDSNSSLGPKPVYELKITNRFPTHDFCPTFGIPRWIFPTQSCRLTRTESQFNSIIFKNLCRELHQTRQGLLGSSATVTERGELKKYYFLTSGTGKTELKKEKRRQAKQILQQSRDFITTIALNIIPDGDRLVMKDVAPEELYLPPRVVLSTGTDSGDDETAASLIRACFEKIKLLSEYTPKCFSSGVCDWSRNYLVRTVRKDDKNPQIVDYVDNRKKRQKSSSEMEREKVHPALLSPNVVEKYRKVHSQAFNLPELSKDYNDN